MKLNQHRVSLGALALVACLALPAGLLSLLSETTTGEQVDASDLVAVGRVAAVQLIESPPSTALEFVIDHVVFGAWQSASLNLTVEGRAPVDVGDDVLVLAKLRPFELLSVYRLQKNPTLLDHEIVTPVTGMMAQGISGGDQFNPVPLSLFEAAVNVRRGAGGRGAQGTRHLPRGPQEGTAVEPDHNEPNDTLADATPVTGLAPPDLLTGNPTILTGLTLTPNDVDFFDFDGGALQVLHAATLAATGLDAPDTLIGLFDVATGELLAHDDDSGDGDLSKFIVPLEKQGTYAIAVESAPDSALDFDGSEGTTTGHYELSVELESGSYLWNQLDLIMGVSPDGTFIEDFIGFKEMGDSLDVLLAGVAADGWAVDFDASILPTGVTHVFGGAGEQLSDPGFTNHLTQLHFSLGPFTNGAGFNRRGTSRSSVLVGYTDGLPPLGVIVSTGYMVSNGAETVRTDLALQMATHAQVTDLTYTRVMDIDLFGEGADEFSWSFRPSSNLSAFAVDTNTNVGNVIRPAQAFGQATGDLQAALLIEHGDSNGTGFADKTNYKCSFTYVRDLATAQQALNEAVKKLRHAHADTWVVAVDSDPDTGLFAAFGAGLGD